VEFGTAVRSFTQDSVSCVLGSGERLVYPSNRVRTANPVSVRVRVMVISASLSSAAVPVSKR